MITYLIELVIKNVFVVGESDDELYHQLSSPCHDCTVCTPVRVFPPDTVVLLMNADHIWSDFALAIGASHDAVKILDHAKTVAAQLQVVRAVTKATVTKVEGLLAVEWVARVCVWDSLET